MPKVIHIASFMYLDNWIFCQIVHDFRINMAKYLTQFGIKADLTVTQGVKSFPKSIENVANSESTFKVSNHQMNQTNQSINNFI